MLDVISFTLAKVFVTFAFDVNTPSESLQFPAVLCYPYILLPDFLMQEES